MLKVKDDWRNVLHGDSREALTNLLPAWLMTRRWFAGKAKHIRSAAIIDVVSLSNDEVADPVELLFVAVEYVNDLAETYLLPIAYTAGARAANLVGDNNSALLATLQVSTGKETEAGVLYDAFSEAEFGRLILDVVGARRRIQGRHGALNGHPLKAFRTSRGPDGEKLPIRVLKAEQSNSSVAYGDRLLLKLFRRLEPGLNPDLEISRFLTDEAHFAHSPPVTGYVEYHDAAGTMSTVGIMQAFVRNEGDAWTYTLENVHRFFDGVLSKRSNGPQAACELPARNLVAAATAPISTQARECCNSYIESAALLGQRTAQMHLALASEPDNPDFAPEPFSELYQRSVYQGLRSLARRTLRMLRGKVNDLPAEFQDAAKSLLAREQELIDRFKKIVGRKLSGVRIRCHGDYHLGQVLFTGKDFVIIDFEGEPARRLSERRLKRSPLRDVAGMLRSFDYAAQTVLLNHVVGMIPKDELPQFQGWAAFWSQWVGTQFLASYLATVRTSAALTQPDSETQTLLEVFLLEKAVYELGYELNNRPTWVPVPLGGILRILDADS